MTFVPGRSFQPNQMFVGKARSHPREEPSENASLRQTLALLVNI
jgi:hypothetical protein